MDEDMNEAFINGGVLTWARKRRGMTGQELAIKLNASAGQVKAWEVGDSYPPFGKAEKLAEILRIPFGYFFLPSNPPDDCPLPDLRTLPTAEKVLSADAIDFVNSVKRKQDWYREYANFFAVSDLPFVGSLSKSSSPHEIGNAISVALGIERLRERATTWSGYLPLAGWRNF